MKKYLLLLILCALQGAAFAQITLLKDINQLSTTTGSDPRKITVMNGLVFFTADDGVHGDELFVSNGMTGNGKMLLDIYPGVGGSYPGSFTVFNVGGTDYLYFAAADPDHGNELWRTDGTTTGTTLVADINPGPSQGIYGADNAITSALGSIFISATDGTHGYELWKSDGTAIGTTMIKDIHASGSSNPGYFASLNGVLFFSATSPSSGTELWVSDGTNANTILLEINSGSSSSNPFRFTAMGNFMYFSAEDNLHGRELWKSNGVSNTLVKDINPSGDGVVGDIALVGNTLLFMATADGVENEIWSSTGATGNATRITDIGSGPQGYVAGPLFALGSTCYFVADDGTHGFELWKTDATGSNTQMLKDIAPGSGYGLNNNGGYAAIGTTLYFPADDGSNGSELWKTDGTTSGTVMVDDINASAGLGGNPDFLVSNGTTLYFSADAGNGTELWKSTGASCTKVVDLRGGSGNSVNNFNPYFSMGATTLLKIDDGSNGVELWRTDGSTAGTSLLQDIKPGGGTSNPQFIAQSGSLVYFSADDGVHGAELWKTNGSTGGTAMTQDYSTQGGSSFSTSITGGIVLGTDLLFAAKAYDGLGVFTELYKYNGASISLVKDINPANLGHSYPSDFTLYNNLVFFTANDGVNGTELWVTDGSPGNTIMVKDINPSGDSNPSSLQVINNVLYFIASDGISNGNRLWKTDGTANGTVMVSDAGVPSSVTSFNGLLYFMLDDGVHGNELWSSDGTSTNTKMAFDFNPGIAKGIYSFAKVGSSLMLSGNNGSGIKFWKSDGTLAGTSLISANGSSGGVVLGNRLYYLLFTSGAWNLYVTDGRPNGTLVINLPTDTSSPDYLATDGTRIYLTLLGLGTGREVYTLDPNQIYLDPLNQPTALVFNNQSLTGLTASWTAATDTPTGYLVIRRSGASPTGVPADGTTYSAGTTLGDGTVAYVGSGLTFTESGLAAGTNYYYDVYSYNGSGAGINYYTYVAPLENNTATLIAAPVATAASSVAQTSFAANWNAATGAVSYRLDVSPDNFATFVSGFQDKTVSGTSATVTGLVAGTTYAYRIRAVNGGGPSANSNTITQLTFPANPAISASAPTLNGFTITWSAITSADSYIAEVANDNAFSTIVYTNSNAVSPMVLSDAAKFNGATMYYARVRAINTAGPSGNSTTASKLTIPDAPNLLAPVPANTTSNSFKADWDASSGTITGYKLEVSTDNFGTLIAGFNPQVFDNLTTETTVTGLTVNTAYQYRVIAYNASGESAYSTVRTVQTLEAGSNPLSISVSASGTSVQATVSGGSAPYTVKVFYKPITAEATVAFLQKDLVEGTPGAFTADLSSDFDELGVKFYLVVTETGNTVTVKKESNGKLFLLVRAYADNVYTVSLPNFGGKTKDYNLFSIPLDLGVAGSDIGEVFNEILPYDKSQWRLARWESTRYLDYNNGENKIQPGKGYWFNSLEKKTIKTGAGTVVKDTVFMMSLDKGWTQIGNPYPFDISWADVLSYNGVSGTAVGNTLKILSSDGSGYTNETVLRTGKGGFVSADAAITLQIPAVIKNGIGSRTSGINPWEITNRDISQSSWLVPLALRSGDAANMLGGFGMHPEASASRDAFDDLAAPRFIDYLEGNFHHAEYFLHDFVRDIVPTMDEYSWEMNVESNLEAQTGTLEWNAEALGNNSISLVLYDPVAGIRVDMRKNASYYFDFRNSRTFRISYSRNGVEAFPDRVTMGKAYPNPFSENIQVPYTLSPEKATYSISTTVVDMMGRVVKGNGAEIRSPGFYACTWDGTNHQGEMMTAGLYLIQIRIDEQTFTTKVVLNR